MQAAIVERAGAPGRFVTVEDPFPSAREILVRIAAAGVNPIDWKQRDLYGRATPFTLGQDFAGTVVATGSDVMEHTAGERIFGLSRVSGAYADRAIINLDDPSSPVCGIPDTVGDAQAAALPTPGLTALACVDAIDASAKSVLIIGVTGSVGALVAQLARLRGLNVDGVGRRNASPEIMSYVDRYFAEGAGGTGDVVAFAHSAYADGYDAVIDCISPADRIAGIAAAVRPGGTIMSINRALDPALLPRRTVNAINVNLDGAPHSNHGGLRQLVTLVRDGSLNITIGTERNFSDAVATLDAFKAGELRGKIILTMN